MAPIMAKPAPAPAGLSPASPMPARMPAPGGMGPGLPPWAQRAGVSPVAYAQFLQAHPSAPGNASGSMAPGGSAPSSMGPLPGGMPSPGGMAGPSSMSAGPSSMSPSPGGGISGGAMAPGGGLPQVGAGLQPMPAGLGGAPPVNWNSDPSSMAPGPGGMAPGGGGGPGAPSPGMTGGAQTGGPSGAPQSMGVVDSIPPDVMARISGQGTAGPMLPNGRPMQMAPSGGAGAGPQGSDPMARAQALQRLGGQPGGPSPMLPNEPRQGGTGLSSMNGGPLRSGPPGGGDMQFMRPQEPTFRPPRTGPPDKHSLPPPTMRRPRMMK